MSLILTSFHYTVHSQWTGWTAGLHVNMNLYRYAYLGNFQVSIMFIFEKVVLQMFDSILKVHLYTQIPKFAAALIIIIHLESYNRHKMLILFRNSILKYLETIRERHELEVKWKIVDQKINTNGHNYTLNVQLKQKSEFCLWSKKFPKFEKYI